MAPGPVKCALFWNIQNVCVPKGERPSDIVRSIRELVTSNSWIEVDFYVACDVYNQPSDLMGSLGLCGLNIIHALISVQNSANEKLKELMIKFVEDKGQNEIAIVLLTDDSDLATVLRGFKRSHNVTIYLIHSSGLSQNLVDCVDKSFYINSFINKPAGNKSHQAQKSSTPLSWDPWLVQITGYPPHIRNAELVAEFRNKAQKQHGKFAEIQRGIVWLSFANKSDAIKIRNELNGRAFKGGRIQATVKESRLLAGSDRPTVDQLALEIDRKSDQDGSRQVNSGPNSPKTFYLEERKAINSSDSDRNGCCSIS